MSSADRRTAAGLFLLTFVAYAYFFGGGGWNQNANFDLTRALVERHTFAIDAYADNTGDVSVHGGHIYANKAPGLSMLAAIPYALGMQSMAAVTIATCALSGALLIALIFWYTRSLPIALVFAFGTYIWAYSGVFFAHVPAALFLFLAFVRRDNPWIAGVASGMAVLCNYASLPAVIVILFMRRDGIAKMIAAAAPFAVVLFAYQAICFGNPLTTSLAASTSNFHTPGALFGFLILPRPDVLLAILFSRYRGLLFLSPVLIFAFAGAVIMVRNRIRTRELGASALIFASFVLFNISFNGWHGGSAIGPRYILPAIPFLALPMMVALRFMRPLLIALAAISIVFNFAVVAVNPLPSRTIGDPIFRYTLPLLTTGRLPADTPPFPPYAWKLSLGHVSVNQQTDDEIATFQKHAPNSPEARWASYNLGEFIAPESVWSLLPIVAIIAAGTLLLVRARSRQPRSRTDR